MKQLQHFIKTDNKSKNFSLLDPEFIEQLAPEVVPYGVSWRTD